MQTMEITIDQFIANFVSGEQKAAYNKNVVICISKIYTYLYAE